MVDFDNDYELAIYNVFSNLISDNTKSIEYAIENTKNDEVRNKIVAFYRIKYPTQYNAYIQKLVENVTNTN